MNGPDARSALPAGVVDAVAGTLEPGERSGTRALLAEGWVAEAARAAVEAAADAGSALSASELSVLARTLSGDEHASDHLATVVVEEGASSPGRFARIYDGLDGEGLPMFLEGRAPLEEPRRRCAVSYLRAGTPLCSGAIPLDDVLDDDSTGIQNDFFTDGTWGWHAAADHLDQHGIAVDDALLEHVERQGRPPGAVESLGCSTCSTSC